MSFLTKIMEALPRRPWNKQDWIVLILIGVLILVVAIPVGSPSGESQNSDTSGKASTEGEASSVNTETAPGADSESTYQETVETQLEALLSDIDGAGKVRVMMTLKNQGEDVLDKDVQSSDNSYQESTVLYDRDNAKLPYVIMENTPQVEGVVVLAEGADNAVVKTQISDAVIALFGLEAHKIQVLKLKS